MPSGQKGTGKKGGGAMAKASRTSTPVPPTASLPAQTAYDPDFLPARVVVFEDSISYDDLVDAGASNATVPDSRSIDAMLSKLKDLVVAMEKRSNFYDRGMRFLADERKKRPDDYGGEEEVRRSKHKRKKASDSLAPPEGGSHGRLLPPSKHTTAD